MNDRAFRRPPANLECEQGVLGSILLDPKCYLEIAAILRPSDFFREAHSLIFAAIGRVDARGEPIDPLSVVTELNRAGEFAEAGGDETIAEVVCRTPSAANARYYADVVHEKAMLRRLIETASEILDRAYGEDLTASELLAWAEEQVLAISPVTHVAQTVSIGPLAAEAAERLDRRRNDQYGGLVTGVTDLDNTTDGLHPGSLIVLAARPSMGKTALSMQICEHVACELRRPALMISLEMPAVDLAERLLVSRGKVDGHKVRTGHLGDRERIALGRAYADLQDCQHLWIDGHPTRTVGEIAALARRFKQKHGLSLLAIDYLQLIQPGEESPTRSNRQEQVAAMSRRLKVLAMQLGCPVLCLSQLNRKNEGREDRRPVLSDLRDSGAIEQDADMVLLLHRPEFYDPNDQPGLAELQIAKNRNGRTGTLKLTFLKASTRFEDHRFDPVPAAAAGDF